ncbi:MAG: cyclic nucleotide-binding domain-containing protein [Pseudomonadota bacterium]
MFEAIDSKSLLIIAAVGAYVLGFLFRDQIYTRLLVVIGSMNYIVYYWFAGPTPLWDAIIGSTLIAASSLQGLIMLCWSRMDIAVPSSARHIYSNIGNIEPGLFRRLIRSAETRVTDAPTTLVEQHKKPEHLWYIVRGQVLLKREGQPDVTVTRPGFIGEIAWMTSSPASATVIADKGVELLCWKHSDLRRAMRYSAKLELALEALIAQDIANKLAQSRPIEAGTARAL